MARARTVPTHFRPAKLLSLSRRDDEAWIQFEGQAALLARKFQPGVRVCFEVPAGALGPCQVALWSHRVAVPSNAVVAAIAFYRDTQICQVLLRLRRAGERRAQ